MPKYKLEFFLKKTLFSVLILTVYGCSTYQLESEVNNSEANQVCVGNTKLPDDIASNFEPIEDASLLKEALGSPKKGKLCQGQAYISKESENIIVFRAWNSTNKNSKFGKWWAFTKPTGKISIYRSEYEICYQWSPLDKLVSCTLIPNTKVIVGNGQSAQCSEYLTYQVSDTQQIYIENASLSLTNCKVFDGEFSWK